MTDDATAIGEIEFTLTRVFDAPRELVWRAWTDPEQLARWFGPRGLTTPRSGITVDLRPGGEARLTMVHDESGAEYPAYFRFREIVEPERLVFNSSRLVDPDTIDERAVVTVTFKDLGDQTEMTFHAAGLTEAEERAGVRPGWSSSFDKLAEVVATVPPETPTPEV